MSSSIYFLWYWRLFAVYFVKQIFYPNTYLFEINFNKILLPFSISYHHLWYQTNYQIKEEDILNNSPTVMFRGTPCTCKLNSAQEDSEMFKRELLKETPEFPFWGVYICVDLNSRNLKHKKKPHETICLKAISTKLSDRIHETGLPKLGFIKILCLKFLAQKLQCCSISSYSKPV